MEKLIYETRPFAFGVLALYAILTSQSLGIQLASGLLLLACSALIIRTRQLYRSGKLRVTE